MYVYKVIPKKIEMTSTNIEALRFKMKSSEVLMISSTML